MQGGATTRRAWRVAWPALLLAPLAAPADEGATSVWVPGQYSSFAAEPSAPGFSLPLVYYHADASASASRQFLIGGQLVAGIDEQSNLLFITPTWAFPHAFWDADAELALGWAVGRVDVAVNGVLNCTDPQCPPALAHSKSGSQWGGSDLDPTFTLKWTQGDNYQMGYLLANAPTGAYEVSRLANIGLNHWAIDGGYGYTYQNQQSGREFSAVVGVTYNFENPATHYRSGLDSHLDFALSQFLNAHWHVGLVGYAYYQLTPDSGSGKPAKLGDFEARVFGLGPEAGFFFEHSRAYLSLRGYWEFGAKDRPEGWTAFLTCSLPIGSGT
jgi:hypothetical protein